MKSLRGDKLRLLSDRDVDKIHLATLRVLEKTGVVVKEPSALSLLGDHGARVDTKNERAWLPSYLVEEAIRKAPKTITLYAKDPKHDLVLDSDRVYFGTGGMAIYVVDLETGERRPSTVKDVEDFAILVNSLQNVHFYMIPFYPNDVPPEKADVARYGAAAEYSVKHLTAGGCHTHEYLCAAMDLMTEHAGGRESMKKRPLMSIIADTVSPLVWGRSNALNAMEAARRGIPVIVGSEALAGGTGPATLAGNMVIVNAEVLAALTIVQLTQPGAPFIYGTISSIMDLKRGGYTAGAVETGMMTAGIAQLAQRYGLPLYGTAGMSDSKVPDCQAGFEKAATIELAALAGANYIHDAVGVLDFCLTMSYEQAVIDDEICGMVSRVMRGITVDDDTLAVDIIEKVGPGGHFLSQPHTLKHMRTEQFVPVIADRTKYDEWLAGGKTTSVDIARAMAKRIIREGREKGPTPYVPRP